MFFTIFRNRKLFDKDTEQRPRQKRSTDTVTYKPDYEDFCVNKLRMQSYDVVSGTLLNATGRMSSDNFAIVTTSSETTTLAVVEYNVKNVRWFRLLRVQIESVSVNFWWTFTVGSSFTRRLRDCLVDRFSLVKQRL